MQESKSWEKREKCIASHLWWYLLESNLLFYERADRFFKNLRAIVDRDWILVKMNEWMSGSSVKQDSFLLYFWIISLKFRSRSSYINKLWNAIVKFWKHFVNSFWESAGFKKKNLMRREILSTQYTNNVHHTWRFYEVSEELCYVFDPKWYATSHL